MSSAPVPAPVPVALYARYSSERQNPRSCAQQLEDCRQYIPTFPGWVEKVVFQDSATSGAAGRDKRPGWDSLLRFIEDGNLAGGVVLAWDWDRWSRDEFSGPIARMQIQQLGVDVADTIDGLFERGMAGQIKATVKEQSSADYLKKLRRAVRRGMVDKVRGGFWVSAVPYGYRRVEIIGGHTLEPVPEHAQLVLELFQRALAGESTTALAHDFTRRGIPTARGCQHWNPTTVRNMLRNPTYTGVVPEYHSKNQEQGRRWLYGLEPILHPGQHPGLVPLELFQAVAQRYKLMPGSRRPKKKPARKYALSGLVRCTVCGRAAVVVGTNKQRKGGLVVESRNYRCRPYGIQGCTNTRLLRVPVLEAAVQAWAHGLAQDPRALELAAAQAVLLEQAEAAQVAQARRPLELELAELERSADQLVALVGAGNAPQLVNSRLQQVQERIDAVREKMGAVGQPVEAVPVEVALEAFREMLAAGAGNLHALRELVDQVELPPAPAAIVLVAFGQRFELGTLPPPHPNLIRSGGSKTD